MSEGNYEYSPGGGGCMSPFGLALAGMALIFMLALAGGDDTTNGNTANMEALSRNQVNLWSDVTNEYYNCYGVGSCVTSVSTSTSTQTTNAPVTVEGDRNNVMTSPWGGAMCWDDSLQTYTTSACQGVQP